MAVILDANALINLYRADILSLIYHRTECIVPAEVYEEVVVGGRKAGHRDADAIADIIGPCTEQPTEILPELTGLGFGEAAALSRYIQRRGRADASGDLIVSDDRQFLRYVLRREREQRLSVRLLTTADWLVDLGTSDVLTRRQTLDALTQIKSRIPASDYQVAVQRLELEM